MTAKTARRPGPARETGREHPPGRRRGVTASVGIETHTGWAVLVAVAGSRTRPDIVLRTRIELANPNDGEAKHLFHAAEAMPLPRARAFIAACRRDTRRRASAELKRVMFDIASAGGSTPSACALLVGAGEKQPTLDAILGSHARIHAAEGDHFRDAIAAAAERAGLTVKRIRRRDAAGCAALALGRPAEELERRIAALRKVIGPPWGSDQRLAALAAWSLL